MYTTIHFIPAMAPRWRPDASFLGNVMSHLGTDNIWRLTAYKTNLNWDTDEYKELYAFSDLKPAEAIANWLSKRPRCCSFDITCKAWSAALWEELKPIPFVLRRNYTPCSVTMSVGQGSICDPWCKETVAKCCCQVCVSGDDMPVDWNAYMELFGRIAQIVALRKFLEDKSDKKWQMLMSSSY